MKQVRLSLDNILKLSTVATILLVTLGYINLKFYYNRFNININDFISTSEIILTAFDNLLLILFSTIIQLLIWVSFFNFNNINNIDNTENNKKVANFYTNDFTEKGVSLVTSNKRFIFYWVTLFVLSLLFLILDFNFPKNSFLHFLAIFFRINSFLFMGIYLLGSQFSLLLNEILKDRKLYKPELIIAFFVFFSATIFTVYWESNSKASQIRKHGNNQKISLLIDGKTVTATDSVRYLGKTNDYYFFWNRFTKISTIYPKSEVKEVNFK